MTAPRSDSHLADGRADSVAPVLSAQAAGLRYVHDDRPGLTRVPRGRRMRTGKRIVPDFEYRDTKGHVVHDDHTLLRIRKLAIPPAWEHVWICPDANGHLQATGRDARGRKQYRYHARWREERDSTKYSRMMEFGRALPFLRRRVQADLRLPGLSRRKVLATVVKLLETTFIRVGNEEYARSNRSFGLTTLETRHVDVHAADVRFHFRGKSGVYHEVMVHDPAIARIVRRCRDLPGQELFQYLDEEGEPASIDSADVNEYIRDLAGHDFTAKDFRTWAGTVLAAHALRDLRDAGVDASVGVVGARKRERARTRKTTATHAPGGDTGTRTARRPNNKDVARAIASVAEQLGNTPSVCRKCYVHPEIISAYLDGVAIPSSRSEAGIGRGRADIRLRPGEQAVLDLLRSRLAEAKAGTRLASQLSRSLRRGPGARAPAGIARARPRASTPHRAARPPRGTRRRSASIAVAATGGSRASARRDFSFLERGTPW